MDMIYWILMATLWSLVLNNQDANKYHLSFLIFSWFSLFPPAKLFVFLQVLSYWGLLSLLNQVSLTRFINKLVTVSAASANNKQKIFLQKKCSGEVLRVGDKYFHTQCFKCSECKTSLSTGNNSSDWRLNAWKMMNGCLNCETNICWHYDKQAINFAADFYIFKIWPF